MKSGVTEQAFVFGQGKSLVGVLSEALSTPDRRGRPTFVILNAGIIHRVGPSRMNVLLARALAEAQFPVLRFDLSGLGDSAPRSDGLAPLESTLADIREAIDWLESTGRGRRVVLMGLCSGATHSLLYANSDPRVVGLVLLDPATPKTAGYYMRHFGPRLFRLSVWKNLLRGSHPRVQALLRSGRGAPDESAGRYAPDLQSPEVRGVLESAYQRALAQGVHLLSIFTSGQAEHHNYREQVLDAFPRVPFGDRMRLEYFRGAEHTFTAEEHRARLARSVLDWVAGTTFSVPAPSDARVNERRAGPAAS